MLCTRCHTENRQGRRFCAKCAAPLAVVCASCGFTNDPGDEFCGGCAQSLRAGTPMPPKLQSPESYTPKHLAEKILTSKAALEGERKQVTVLFADLKGSMELLADRDPEEARKLLDPVLKHMMEAVHRYEGTVNQVMGDGIMALFGAPLAHEDHAVRACYAALRMQDAVRRYSDQLRRAQGVEVQIRVGLNSGEVVVRSIGSDLRMDYTAVGQTTHLAARMEQLATPGTVRLTGETLRLAEGYVEVRSLGPIPVKGLSEPIEIFELTGAGQARTRLQAAALRGLTRFVGRDTEIEHLRRVLGQAGAGHGQVVAIVGEAGVGKSRLTYEFTHSHRVQDWLILEASTVSYGKATSYLPVIDLLTGYFKIGDRDSHREMRDKVMGRVLGLDRALEPLLPPLLALLDVPVEDATWQTLDALQRRQRTLDAVKRLLLRESQGQPLLLVFEDLHWIDGETQALLDSLVDSLGPARLLLLVNYRPEYEHGWSGKTAYSQMRLDALPAESAAELLEGLLGGDPSLAPLKRLLVKRGNPLFLEETVRMLVETKALEGSRGQYRLTQPLQALQVPATVQTILAARIDRLSPEDKRLLQTAAVVGKDVPFALLHAIAEPSDEALRAGLDRLRAAEFLYETGLYPDLEYAFKHALTHEVTYDSLLQERRRNLHAQLVGAIERRHGDRLGEHIERLAHHAFRGELWEKAVDYNRRAGARAYTREAFSEAVIGFERAIQAADHLPEGPGARELAIDLRAHLRTGLTNTGQLDRGVDLSRDVFERASALGDATRLARAATGLANALYLAGRLSEALEASRRACALAEPLGDPRLLALARWNFAQVCEAIGNYAPAVDVMEANLELCRQYPDLNFGFLRGPVAEVMSRSWLAWGLAQRGDFRRAVAVMQPAIDLADPKESPYLRTAGFVGVGYVHLLQGEIARAVSYLERGLHLCTSFALPIWMPVCAGSLGYSYTLDGRLAEGRDLLRRAVDASTGVNRVHHARWLAWLGEAHLLSTDLEQAAEAARTALAMARERGERGNEVWALRLQAEIAAAGDPSSVTTAETRYREAIVLAEQLGLHPLVAHCHLGLSKLYRRTGKAQEAQEHLATATTMYREMDMRFWLEQAEAEMNQLE